MVPSMIVTKDLTKIFAKKAGRFTREKIVAVDHINLKVKKGEIFGLIGPTGAGKTTTIKMLSTLILPDEGTATINGYDVIKDAEIIKKKIGSLAGEFTRTLYWRLPGRENLKFFAKLKNIRDVDEKVEELLDLFDLKKWGNELVMRYSTGMKHKLAFAVSLLNDPSILFLDEPFTGIDPLTAYNMKNLIRERFKENTIIWTSHNLYEIEEMCDRIALMNRGEIILEGNPEELKQKHWGYEKIVAISNNASAFDSIRNAEIKNNVVEIKTKNITKTLIEVMKIAKEKNIRLEEVKTLRPSFEEVFMKEIKNVGRR